MRRLILLFSLIFLLTSEAYADTFRFKMNSHTKKQDWVVDTISSDNVSMDVGESKRVLFSDAGAISSDADYTWADKVLEISGDIKIGGGDVTVGTTIVDGTSEIVFTTNQGTNTNTKLGVKGKGTGVGHWAFYDEDNQGQLLCGTWDDVGYIWTFDADAATPADTGHLDLQTADEGHVGSAVYIGSGCTHTREGLLRIYGYPNGGALKYGYLTVQDATSDFHIGAENDIILVPTGGDVIVEGNLTVDGNNIISSDVLYVHEISSDTGVVAFHPDLELRRWQEIRFYDQDDDHYVGLKSPQTVNVDKIWLMPMSDSATTNVPLMSTGGGTLFFSTDFGANNVTTEGGYRALDSSDDGIIISGAAGVMTIAGVGMTNNENLTFDFETTANKVAIGTGTGVTDIDWGALNHTTTGLITTGNLDVDTLNLNGNSITDSTGTIDFGNENITLTGMMGIGVAPTTTDGLKIVETWTDDVAVTATLQTTNTVNTTVTRTNASYGLFLGSATHASMSDNMSGLLAGIKGEVTHNGSGTLTSATGSQFQVINAGSGILTNGIAFHIKAGINSGGGTLWNCTGLYIDEQTTAGNNNNEAFIAGAGEIFFRDQAIHVGSLDDGHLDLTADTSIDLNGLTNIGDGGTTNYVEISATGDQVFVGSGGLPFAEIYVADANDTITIAAQGKANKVQITSFTTNGVSNNMTPDHTNDHITVVKAGMYLCNVSMHLKSAAAGGADTFGYSVYKNNGATEFANLHGQRDVAGGGGDEGSISLSGIIDLAANDTIEVWIWNIDSTDDIIVDDINLSLLQIGGT